MVATFFQSFCIDFDRRQWQNEIILRNGAVMDHPTKWSFIPALFRLLSIFVDCVYDDVATGIMSITSRFVAVAHHLPRIRIEFWMSGKCWRLHLSIKVISANRLESDGIHGEGWAIFFHCKQYASPENYIGIRCCSDDTFYHLVVGVWVSVFSQKRFPSLGFRFEAICVHISLSEINMPILESER